MSITTAGQFLLDREAIVKSRETCSQETCPDPEPPTSEATPRHTTPMSYATKNICQEVNGEQKLK